MANKPGDFLIGVVDFFAVLLPGAVVAFFGLGAALRYAAGHGEIFGTLPSDFWADTRGWVVFGIASYLLGQFVYLLGSSLDWVYNLVREQFKTDGRGLRRWKAGRLLGRKWIENEELYRRATRLKEREVGDARAVNTFQWAKANVTLQSPDAAADVHRLEADQKFFRGLIVVLVIVCALFWRAHGAAAGELLPIVVLILLSFWKYIDQRRKSQSLAYIYLITMKAQPPAAGEPGGGRAD